MRQLTILLTLLLSLPLLWSALPAQADEVTEDAIMYAPAPDTLVKRVDSFFFIMDESGSMNWDYKPTNEPKLHTAAKLMEQLNARIPELDYDAGLVGFAPYELKAPAGPFSQSAYSQALSQGIPESTATIGLGNPTPLGNGFRDFEAVVEPAAKPVAAILLSDGRNNTGAAPLAQARNLVKNHQVCLHVISLANTGKGQALLDQLAELESDTCQGVVANADELLGNPSAQDAFLQKVLYTVQKGDPGPLAPAAPSTTMDSDGDGVVDNRDRCPDTPKDLAVDDMGCPIPVEFELNVTFDYDRAEVKPEFFPQLAELAQLMKANPEADAVIEGHTDSTGPDEYNLGLSQRRAQSVVDALVSQHGISADRFRARGYGEEQPVATNDTAAGRAQNRRVIGILPNLYVKR